jgi:hypothetical protein
MSCEPQRGLCSRRLAQPDASCSALARKPAANDTPCVPCNFLAIPDFYRIRVNHCHVVFSLSFNPNPPTTPLKVSVM